jgi:hypothetical protein
MATLGSFLCENSDAKRTMPTIIEFWPVSSNQSPPNREIRSERAHFRPYASFHTARVVFARACVGFGRAVCPSTPEIGRHPATYAERHKPVHGGLDIWISFLVRQILGSW